MIEFMTNATVCWFHLAFYVSQNTCSKWRLCGDPWYEKLFMALLEFLFIM